MTDSSDAPRIDSTKGVAANPLSPARRSGRVGDDDVLAGSRRRRVVRRRARTARITTDRSPRPGCRRHRPMPLASRLFQSAHRRGASRAGARSDRVLARRARGRRSVRPRKTAASRQSAGRPLGAAPRLGRHRRRRRGGPGGRGHAAARRLRRPDHDDQRRRRRRPAIGRTCRKTIWRARRRTTGFRCGRRSSMPSSASSCCSDARVSALDLSRATASRSTAVPRARSARC